MINTIEQKKIWERRPFDANKSASLAADLQCSQLIADLLSTRGFEAGTAKTYLHPSKDQLYSPFLFNDMQKAVDRIKSALLSDEKIWIYGDYDTDGTTAAALLINVFRHLGKDVDLYIPNRFEEGYGMNSPAIKTLSDHGCDLIITVDCGISSVEEVGFANSLDIDVIITDHHEPPLDSLPPAVALIAPKNGTNSYPFDGLAGVGLAFKLAQALLGDAELPFLETQLDLVALGTVVDIASLTDENRVLSALGLTEINKRHRPGIRALCEVAGHDEYKPIVGRTLSFVLGPRLNAAGRMGIADSVVKLLTTDSDSEAKKIATALDGQNIARREIQNEITDLAIARIEEERAYETRKVLVVMGENWHQGVIGVVASRLVEQYGRPAFVFTIEDNIAQGSGRGIEGMNLVEALNSCDDLLIQYGGHETAAGLSINADKMAEFSERINDYADAHLTYNDLIPRLKVDMIVTTAYLSIEAVEELNRLEPFGADNAMPRLAICGLRLEQPPTLIGKQQNHLKLFVTDGWQVLEAIGWNMADYYPMLCQDNIKIDLAFKPEINEWGSIRRIQLMIDGIRESASASG